MLRTPYGLAVAAMLAIATPAAATFTVSASGTTTLVTQTDADTLILTRTPNGELVASDSSALVIHPPTANLFVRGTDAASPSSVFVVLDSELPGSLTLDLPGANEAVIRGAAGSIAGSLRIRGGAADQIVRLGGSGEPTRIARSASIDLGDGRDELQLLAACSIGGSLASKGVSVIDAKSAPLTVARNVSVDGDDDPLLVETDAMVVGKSFKLKGQGGDTVRLVGGTIGRSATFDFRRGWSHAVMWVDTIGGSFKASYGFGERQSLSLGNDTVVKGSVAVTMSRGHNLVYLGGTVQGTSIRYTGTEDGADDIDLALVAPRAKATFQLGDGNDQIVVDAAKLRLDRLALDFGAGTDFFDDDGWVAPSGSIIKGLP